VILLKIKMRRPKLSSASYNARQRIKLAANHVALYEVIAIALESVSAMAKPITTLHDAVKAATTQMTLEHSLFSHQISFHNLIDIMKRDEKAQIVFTAFDIHDRKSIGVDDLEVGLRHCRLISSCTYPTAEELIQVFASHTNGNLTSSDFENLIDGLAASSRDCNYDDMCHLLLHSALFTKTGGEIVRDTVLSIAGQSKYRIEDAIYEARLILLFRAMDEECSGHVMVDKFMSVLDSCRPEISSGRVTYRNFRKLDYEMFSENMVELSVHCTTGGGIKDVLNDMTIALCAIEIADKVPECGSVAERLQDSLSSIGTCDSLSSRSVGSQNSLSILAPMASLLYKT
jgi:hypothetical protein